MMQTSMKMTLKMTNKARKPNFSSSLQAGDFILAENIKLIECDERSYLQKDINC